MDVLGFLYFQVFIPQGLHILFPPFFSEINLVLKMFAVTYEIKRGEALQKSWE